MKKKFPILFGSAGPPETAKQQTSEHGVHEVVRLGLDTMELEFVRGVRMGPDTAQRVRAAAEQHAMPLSAHAPYYVNLASKESAKVEASIKRVLDTARAAHACGADQVVFHPGFFQNRPPDRVFGLILENVRIIRNTMNAEGMEHIILRPELTGKPSQFGAPDELFRLCREAPGVLPCLDFSHHYARTLGQAADESHFRRLLDDMAEALGADSLKNIHGHLSGIDYGKTGETRHQNMAASGMDHKPVLRALKAAGARGRIICESPDRGHDARSFKRYWKRYLRK